MSTQKEVGTVWSPPEVNGKGRKRVCQDSRFESEWIVILLIENTGFHKWFWCWKIMGSIFKELG